VKGRKKKWKPACGTQAGLIQHLNAGQRPCRLCLIGNSTYSVEEIRALAKDLRRHSGEQHLWRTYQLSIVRFDQIFDEQDRRCACCKTTRPGESSWCIDHDHDTGQIRGILCSNCNTGIGFLGDSVEGLQRASDYLKAHHARGGHKRADSPPAKQFVQVKVSVVMQRAFELFKQGVPRNKVVVILRLAPDVVDDIHGLWVREGGGEVIRVKRHMFQIAKDPPQRFTCACGYSAPWNEPNEMEAAVERVNAHVRDANEDLESEWQALKAEEDQKVLWRLLEEKRRGSEEEERQKAAKRLLAIEDMRRRQALEQQRLEEEERVNMAETKAKRLTAIKDMRQRQVLEQQRLKEETIKERNLAIEAILKKRGER
jgi:hypothetical protein